MNKVLDFLSGTQVLETVHSPLNGIVSVIRSLSFGTYIQVGNLTQSGGILRGIWRKTLNEVYSRKSDVRKCLVLGLGGGSVIPEIKRIWPDAEITGVDIDPVMVEMGKKYLGLGKYNLEVVITDAESFLTSNISHLTSKYDLILIDLYHGRDYPEKFGQAKFLTSVSGSLVNGGIAVFNRVYYGKIRESVKEFNKVLLNYFPKVSTFHPHANLMYICENS